MEDKIISNENINKMRELTDSIVSDESLKKLDDLTKQKSNRIKNNLN